MKTSSAQQFNLQNSDWITQQDSPLKNWFKYHLEGLHGHYIGDSCWQDLMSYLTAFLCDEKKCSHCFIRELCKKGQDSNKKETEAFYAALIDDGESLICRYLPDGSLALVNNNFCRFFGKSKQQLIGHNFVPLMPLRDQKYYKKKFDQLSHSNPTTLLKYRVIMANGQIRWMKWHLRIVFDPKGKCLGYQAIGKDLTGPQLNQ